MGKAESLPLGIIGGIIGAVIGAALWGGIVALTGWQIGLFAVGVGFLAGFGVQFLGHGTTMTFGIVGAILALAGCVLGDVFAVVMIVSRETGLGMSDVLSDTNGLMEIVKAKFTWFDLVFYAIALYCGFTYSIKPVTPNEKQE
jgi:hypothetical protein